MERGQLGVHTLADLEPIIGKSNRVYEVLNRKRPLTLAMIRRLHKDYPGSPVAVVFDAKDIDGGVSYYSRQPLATWGKDRSAPADYWEPVVWRKLVDSCRIG
mgnify:CR=1 FL=1